MARWTTFGVTLGITLATAGAARAASDRSMHPIALDPIQTTGGAVAGTALPSGVRAYLGIPYAEPPVGDLRWAPPRTAHWSGLYNADRKGAECIQVLRPHDINHYFGEEPSGEDCLTLNLWAPASTPKGERLPVIVFLYGGGFTIGSSGMANYDGEAMARAGAIFVNFNYRVGALGFLAHPELTREQGGASGNYGLMDQTLALRWVHDNVARFGGDPEQVVIMGQSAGAFSVAAQMLSPAARGLFRGAVLSSACVLGTERKTLTEAEQTGLALEQRLGVHGLAALRALPADRILAAQSESQLGLAVSGVRIEGPIVDGRILPRQAAQAVAAGDFAKVPVIASFNSDDLAFGFEPLIAARDVAGYRAAAAALFGPDSQAFLRLYPVERDEAVRATARRAAQDANFAAASRGCARDLSAKGLPVWVDEFAHRHPYAPGLVLADQDVATVGAYHTADIPYWFGTLEAYNALRPTRQWTAFDRDLSTRMMGALIAFARTGSPSTPALPWPAWDPRSDARLVLDDPAGLRRFDRAGQEWLATHRPAPVLRSNRPRD